MNYTSISELHPNLSHTKVVGIIIGKTDIRSFPDRKNVGMDRFIFGFTVKDSPDFFINVTAWGDDNYINGLSKSFNIGDVVIIDNPLVATKDAEREERFCPATPSPYRLMLAESHSKVRLCADLDTSDSLLPLMHMPVKDSRDFYSLGDVVANGQSLDGSVINILAAVKATGEIKLFRKSDGSQGQRLEVKLFDEVVSSFPLICWDKEAIQLVQTSLSKGTVIFVADTKINFDRFRNGMTATVNSKTIITVNPDTQEAGLLCSYAKKMLESGALEQDDMPENVLVESITDVYTVSQLKKKGQENMEVSYGITYCFISKLDLDSSVSKVIKTRCAKCKFLVEEGTQYCTNQLCPGRGQAFSSTVGFDLMVDLTDHTGTLHACTLRSPVAEAMLGCTTQQFTRLTDNERTALKWKFLLERCKIYVKILPSTRTKSGFLAVVLACSLADSVEVKQFLSILLKEA
ncbi:meiosis-specific with OB domain-containing protein [Corythoichthys intestinalis]|uniref:meiosis-specific with OB domain-containing protein n=1 Tax=Corythoichthys intestinalis TaxID=161448 RepID=UPI0025A62501|nr:meiosis-specific with OB domain-containing protein [Corythoichthys intestinalis]XP_061807338.1 meiosis-specific with OB domain-containing protein-like [Nerophis lumbriciformis]